MIVPSTDVIMGYGETVQLNCDSCNLTKNGDCITIRDADFGNNGFYQCVNNGSINSFSVAVYGECISSTVCSVLTWL